MKTAKSAQKGFTLIELMIVVAIIAILAAIAIPAYQNYLIRAQVSEGITLMDQAKVAISEFYANSGDLSKITKNSDVGIEDPSDITGKYVTSVTVGSDGLITAAFGTPATKGGSAAVPSGANKAIQNDVITMKPTATKTNGEGNLTWTCGSSTDGTTVDGKYLPSTCRGS
jgi:type IV pilus assembly protein PilA